MELQVLDVVLYCVFTVAIGWLVHLIYRWRNPACNGKIPPGSMGLPVIGETLQLLKRSPSVDIAEFYKLRFKRYGSLFKTSLGGESVVVSMDMEFNRFVFRQNDKLFQLWYPETMMSIIGKKTMATGFGQIHKHLRSMLAPHYAPRNLNEAFISEMECIIAETLRLWATKPSIEVKVALTDGRKYVQNVLKDSLKERISAPQRQNRDILDIFVEDLRSGEALVDENFMVDAVAGLIFAGILLAPTSLSLGMKFLTDNPNVVQALTEEHEAIQKKQEEMNSKITWEECKSTKFTNQVINEILRASSHAPGIFRKALKDVQVNGYIIPKGWLVLINPMAAHLNPSNFKDPLNFNPWRWQDAHLSSLRKNFIPFGDGARYCMGADLTKLQMTMFLHELVTKYRWKEINEGQKFRISDLVFIQDYRIQLFPRS